jgi:hypothetical protein
MDIDKLTLNKKYEFYELLKTIQPPYLQPRRPFDILRRDGTLTRKEIKLKYIKDLDIFVESDRKQQKKKRKGGKESNVILIFS